MDLIQRASKIAFNPSTYVNIESSRVESPILFYIIRIENISESRLRQLESWEELEDPNNASVDRVNKHRQGNNTKNNRVIREVDMSDDPLPHNNGSEAQIYRLLLKDCFDNYSYGYEFNDKLQFLRSRNSNGGPLPIVLGSRIIVYQGALILNGVIMLESAKCKFLGTDGVDKGFLDSLNLNIISKYANALRHELHNG